MGKTKKKTTTRNADKTTFLLEKIVEGMQEKKASGIVVMDLTKLSSRVSDYFVICNADNTRQVAAIADSVEDFTTRFCEEKPWHVEGIQNAQWILMDYVNVVVHVFQSETRDFYGIENLWADADVKRIED
jgi:ribosome-associated protein